MTLTVVVAERQFFVAGQFALTLHIKRWLEIDPFLKCPERQGLHLQSRIRREIQIRDRR